MTTFNRLRHDTAPLAGQLADRIHALAKEYDRLKLLTAPDVGKFLRDEIRDAEAYLRCTRLRLSVGSPSGRMDDGGTE